MAKKILIIDDDPIVVKYLENIFHSNGYETMAASSGLEGAEALQKNQPDLITLDLQMPGQWGPRFYRNLRKKKVFSGIPVIVITGLSGGKHSIPKAAGYLSKPFEPHELVAIVKQTIGGPDDNGA